MKNSARITALKDISNEIKSKDLMEMTNYTIGDVVFYEIWTVTPTYLDNKETRRLNRELGLWSVNKGKHNMNRK
jgi:hypothetical protein